MNNSNTKNNYNIPKKERLALERLSSNDDIIIKKADKGGATVVMNKSDYNKGILTILEDKETYSVVESYDIKTTMIYVENFVIKNRNAFTKNELDYWTNFDSKTANMYGLPKVHKSKLLNEELNLYMTDKVPGNISHKFKDMIFQGPFNEYNITFRPIVSGLKCPISRLCELAKILLRPFELLIPNLIMDTFHFLETLEKETDAKNKLIAIDIVKLYPSNDATYRRAVETHFRKLTDAKLH